MNRLSMIALSLACATLAGCEEDLLADLPDAAVEVDAPPLPAGNFACVGMPWQTTSVDPLRVGGRVAYADTGDGAGNVPVEIRTVDGDVLLAQGVTENTVLRKGSYTFDVATSGIAPRIYRKFTPTDFLETYTYDPMAQFSDVRIDNVFIRPAFATGQYQFAGLTPDPTKGIVLVQVLDCSLPPETLPVEGATIDAPPGAKVLYVSEDGALDNPDLTATTSIGQAIIVGITPGMTDITVHAGPITYRPWPIQVHANAWNVSPRHP